jgi:electron transport complex protein RnfB
MSRRDLLRGGARGAFLAGLGYLAGLLTSRSRKDPYVWQIDPYKCIGCDNCAKNCVLEVSAVKCVHTFPMCGYCELCTGFFEPQPNDLNTGAENQLCPTGAIVREFVEEPYYKYHIDEPLCIGCGKCVKGCNAFGNGSLQLQVMRDRCVDCNECAIAVVCPADAFVRVPIERPYQMKGMKHTT